MGQAIAARLIQQQAESAAANVAIPGVDQSNTDGGAWWCKLLAKAAGAISGFVGLITGLVGAITSVLSPLCIVACVLLMISSVVVLVFEAPICCTFIPHTKPIATFAENRTQFQKAILYCAMALVCFAMCPSVATFFGCGLIFATGVIYGLMGLGRKADRQQMIATAAGEQPRTPAGGSRPDDSRVGLIDNESALNAEPFVGQNFPR